MHRAATLILAFAATVLILAPSAQAHAALRSADPPVNGHADVGVAIVEVRFTEAVERQYTSLDIVNLHGESVAAGSVEFDAASTNVIRLPVTPLKDGIYTVNWRALSADGHTVRGGYLFSVGNATIKYAPPAQAADESQYTLANAAREGVPKAAYYAGLFLALGAPLFLLVVARDEVTPRRSVLVPALVATVGALAALLGLAFLTSRTDASLAQAIATDAGRSYALRAVFLLVSAAVLAAAGLTRNAGGRRVELVIALALAAASLVATTQGSHAASVKDGRELAILLDGAHLLMGAVWVGGVATFLLILPQDAERAARLLRRFSPIALTSVLILLATGTLASLRSIPAWNVLWTQDYGRLVSLKTLLLVVLIGFGAAYQRVLAPRLERRTTSPRTFRRALAAEALVMALVLVAAGTLASTAPPRQGVEEGTQGPGLYYEAEKTTAKTHVILQIQPNPPSVGPARILVTLHPLTSGGIPNQTQVALKLTPPGQKETDQNLIMNKTGPTEWTRDDVTFTEAGAWSLLVLVQRPDEYARVTFVVNVTAPGAPQGGRSS